MNSIGIFAPSEVLYNPRLLKHSEVFKSNGIDVTIYNPVKGNGSYSEYTEFRRSRKYIKHINFYKHSLIGLVNVIILNIVYKIYLLINRKRSVDQNPYYLNKYWFFLQFLVRKKHDIILVNVIDILPIAAAYKKKNKKVIIIYDSQEFFTGQYPTQGEKVKSWVELNEIRLIQYCDVVCSTTNIMKLELANKYGLKKIFRVRNLPLLRYIHNIDEHKTNLKKLKFVWHGMAIYFDNERGIKLIIDGLRDSGIDFELTLQGNCLQKERIKIHEYLELHKLEDKVFITNAVHPEKIIYSLKDFDVGIIGEIPKDKNQQITSSNKLFDYLHAKLFIIAPNLPGIAETFMEYPKIGNLYDAGSLESLVNVLEKIDRNMLNRFRKYELEHLNYKNIVWESDVEPLLRNLF